MMKRFLLPVLGVAVLAGSGKAEDRSTETAWMCTSQTFGRAEYIINGNEVQKRDDDLERYEACRRGPPAPALGPDGKISSQAVPVDPCEPPDLESYTFTIELNNSAVLVAVSPAAGRDTTLNWVAKRLIILDKLTGRYVETLLSTPTVSRGPDAKNQSEALIAGNEYGGTCEMKALGDPNLISSAPNVSRNLDSVVDEQEKPQNRTDARKAHVHVHRPDHHYKHVRRHGHHYKFRRHDHRPKITRIKNPPHFIRRADKNRPDRP